MTLMRGKLSLVLASALALPGCSLLHSNIKGGFACAAPHGTCAPSTTIDDAALRMIGGQDARDSDGAPTPSRPNLEPAKPGLTGDQKFGKGREWVFVRGDRPALKVVFPAWRDGAGHVHARTTAYAPIDLPQGASAKATPLDADQLDAEENSSLLAIAELAPDAGLIGSSPSPTAPVAAHASGEAAPVSLHVPGNPGSLGSASPNPLDAIKDQVRQILATTKKSQAYLPAPKPDPTPAQPGASFPPKGS